MSMRVSLQPAYLLHRRPYRDSSQLLEVWSLDFGRLGLIARGTRRAQRGGSLASLLQPFRPLLLSFAGRGELKTLQGVETAGELAALRGEALFSGFYLNELLMRALQRGDPQPALFAAYAAALDALAAGGALEPSLRRFELTLLDVLGYGFALDREAGDGVPLDPDTYYVFRAGEGLLRAPPASSDGREAPLRLAGSELLALAAGELEGGAGRAAKQLLRAALVEVIGPQPLHSRTLFRQRARGGAGTPDGA